MVKLRRDPDHIFSITNWLIFGFWVVRLVGSLLEVVKDRVAGGLADRRVEICGMRGVEWEFCPIGEGKRDDTSVYSKVGVEASGSSMKADGGTLRKSWEVGAWGSMPSQDFLQIAGKLLVSVL